MTSGRSKWSLRGRRDNEAGNIQQRRCENRLSWRKAVTENCEYKLHARYLWVQGDSARNKLSLHLLIPITVRGRAMGGVEAEPDRGLGAAIQDFPSVTTSPTPSLLSINGFLDEVGSSGDSTPHCFSPPKFSVRLPPIRTPPPITRQVTGKKFFSLLSSDPISLACDMLFSVLSLSLSVPNGESITSLSFPDNVGLSKQLRTVGGTEKMLVSCMNVQLSPLGHSLFVLKYLHGFVLYFLVANLLRALVFWFPFLDPVA